MASRTTIHLCLAPSKCMLRIDFVFALRRVSVFPLLVVSLFASRSGITHTNEPSQIRVTVSPIPAMVVA